MTDEPFTRLIVFTLNRSGSMALFRVCRQLAKAIDITLISSNGGTLRIGQEQFALESEIWLNQPRSCVGPIRFYVPVPEMDTSRLLLQLRDPRDVLVSMFYSYCYSHPGPVEPGQGCRAEVAKQGIDTFVLKLAESEVAPVEGDYGTSANLWDIAGNLMQRYNNYVEHVLPHPNTIFVRYEDMVLNPSLWLQLVGEAFNCNRAEVLANIQRTFLNNPIPNKENPLKHVRQVMPGDHRRKLKPETIQCLNNIFAPILQPLGYSC